MSDRELLELAAKAAGMFVLPQPWPEKSGWFYNEHGEGPAMHFRDMDHPHKVMKSWRPLADGDDALRLAATLGICIEPYPLYEPVKHSVICKQRRRSDQLRGHNPTEVVELYRDSDPDAATRRAIVRCAAAIQAPGATHR